MEIRDLKSNICGILVKKEAHFQSLNFLTNPKDEFQLGVMNRGPESPVFKHKHNSISRNIKKTSEFLLIRSGEALLTIWSEDNELIDNYVLNAGDSILLISGYHEINFLSDCQILEIKQGPYEKNLDKTYEK